MSQTRNNRGSPTLAGVDRRGRFGIGLVPSPRGAPQAPQKRLTGMRRKAATVGSKQLHEAPHIRAVLEGKCAVHVGFAGEQLGVEEQLCVEPGIVQTDGNGRACAVTAERVQSTVSGNQVQDAVADEAIELMGEQPLWQSHIPAFPLAYYERS
jgi:hypothetical protein